MSDLIKRQDAIDIADRADYTKLAIEDVKKVTDEVVKELKKLPSADVVEVVRCKDCEHWNTVVEPDKAENGLCYGFKFFLFVTSKDEFCFKGERRSE